MASNKEFKKTTPLHAAIALLDAKEHCQDICVVVDDLKKSLTDLPKTKSALEIRAKSNLLLKAVPLIADSIEGQVRKCTPPGTNPTFVRNRLQKEANPSGLKGFEKLKMLVHEASSRRKNSYKTPNRNNRPKRKASYAIVSPNHDEDDLMPPDCPTPSNNKFFLIEEAVTAYQQYPHNSKKRKLLSYWEKNRWKTLQ